MIKETSGFRLSVRFQLLTIAGLFLIFLLVAVFAVRQLDKAATFHHINFLHIKHTAAFDTALRDFGVVSTPNSPEIREIEQMVRDIRDQPVDCLNMITVMERILLPIIGTGSVIQLCVDDIAVGDRALGAIAAFNAGTMSVETFAEELSRAVTAFLNNSVAFEEPVERTVAFIVTAMTLTVVMLGAIGLIATLFIVRRLAVRLRRLQIAIENIGQTVADNPDLESHDEIGSIARAIDIFSRAQMAEGVILKDIVEVASAVSGGDFEKRLNTDTTSNLGNALAAEFNQMVERLSTIIGDIRSSASAMARGDLTNRISVNGQGSFAEVASDINHAMEHIQGIVSQIGDSGHHIHSAVEHIRVGAERLDTNTNSQASSLEHTTFTVGAISRQVSDNAQSARHAAEIASSARERGEKGHETMSLASEAMRKIDSNAKTISTIMEVIGDIAFQTNLLALNASVEAARAGESGKGFSVVASEVRVLSERTFTASKDIGELIEETVRNVQDGVSHVSLASDELTQISKLVSDFSESIAEISKASTQQSLSLGQASDELSKLDTATQENRSLSKQNTELSHELTDKATNLHTTLEFFSAHRAHLNAA
jgi:methyl-accepting chemotaxis protein